MLLFIDTEFTDLLNPVLISVGIVAQGGAEFYGEIPVVEDECTAFVRKTVLPLLGKEPNAACTKFELRSRILTWMETIRPTEQEIVICADNQIDIDLLCDALDFRPPGWMAFRLIGQDVDQSLVNRFFAEEELPRHHALYDARANRYAYRSGCDQILFSLNPDKFTQFVDLLDAPSGPSPGLERLMTLKADRKSVV